MYGITVVTEKKKKEKQNGYPMIALLCLIMGVYGILQLLESLTWAVYSKELLYVISGGLSIFLWYFFFYHKRFFKFFMLALSIFFVTAVYLWREQLWRQGIQIANIFLGESTEAVVVNEWMVLLTVFVTTGMFAVEILLQNHTFLYLLTSALLLISPFAGVHPQVGAVVLIIIFQVSFWVMLLTKGSDQKKLRGKSLQVMAAVLTLCFFTVYLLGPYYEQHLYNLAFDLEEHIYHSIDHILGKNENQIADGTISNGNIYQDGTVQLEVVDSGQPSETMYLRAFSGGEYVNGNWERANDEQLLEKIAQSDVGEQWGYRIRSMYNRMFFVMNSNTGDSEPLTLTIYHLDDTDENTYVPYFSQRKYGWNLSEGYPERRGGDTFQYFEQKDMEIDWDQVPETFEYYRDQYLELRNAYMREISTDYIQVPTETIPRLTSLVEQNPKEGLDEISDFILQTLHSRAVYTRTPGWAPFTDDPAEYFLFESGRGYCQHFALTATLMYRLYGIPARYAAGYMVSPSDFEQQENGTYRALVTDENAHAWTEIFLEDYGWVPIETTPSSGNSEEGSEDLTNNTEMDESVSEEDTGQEQTEETETSVTSEVQEENKSGNPEINRDLDDSSRNRSGLIVIGSFFGILILISAGVYYRRVRHLKQMETMNCRMIFSKWISMLHFAGYCMEFDGSEEAFASACMDVIPVITEKEIHMLQDIVSEAAYSAHHISTEKEHFVKDIYDRTAEYIGKNLKWDQKLIFYGWKNFH